jgi:hypothetical protein
MHYSVTIWEDAKRARVDINTTNAINAREYATAEAAMHRAELMPYVDVFRVYDDKSFGLILTTCEH